MTTLRPPFIYFGAKMSVAPQVVAMFPEHGHYVEPFAGSLSVLLAKPPSLMETVNDIDGDLMAFWRMMRDRPDDLIQAAALTPHARDEYDQAFEPCGDDLERARRVWVRLTQGRSGSMRRTAWRFTVGPGHGVSLPGYLDGYRSRMPAAAARLMNVSLECRPAADVIKDYGADPGVLIYADPPYLGALRRSERYSSEMETEDEHRELADSLRTCRSAVVLSGYHSPLYDDLYHGWHQAEIATQTGNGTGDRTRTEVLWSNRPLPAASTLFDA